MLHVRRHFSLLMKLFAVLTALIPILLALIYTLSYRLNVPFRDEWALNGHIATLTYDNALQLEDLFFVYEGHRAVFTNIVTAFFATSGWDIRAESLVNVALAITYFIVLLVIVKRTKAGLLSLVLIPCSLLVFSLYREHNWWSVRHSQWAFVNLFVLGSLLILTWKPLTVIKFALASILGVCATFCAPFGMLVWPVMFLVLLLAVERNWKWFVLWSLIGFITIALYLRGSGIFDNPDPNNVLRTMSPQAATIEQIIVFILTTIGAGIFRTPEFYLLTTLTGLAGLIVFGFHGSLLWRQQKNFTSIAPWIGIATYSIGTAILLAWGRAERNGIDRAFSVQYVAVTGLFWVSLIVMMAMVVKSLVTDVGKVVNRRFVLSELVLSCCLLLMYGYSTQTSLQAQRVYWNHSMTLEVTPVLRDDEQCVRDYPFTRVEDCLARLIQHWNSDPNVIDELAARRLAIFSTINPISILPMSSSPDSRIAIITSDAWLNVHIRDYLLSGVTETQLFHIIDDDRIQHQIEDLPNGLRAIATDASQSAVDRFSSWAKEGDAVWVLETAHAPTFEDAFLASLTAEGFQLTTRQLFHHPISFTLSTYELSPRILDTLYLLGGHIRLNGWQLDSPTNISRCDLIRLETLWSTDTLLHENLSMTAVLADSNGIGIIRADGAPSGEETSLWQPNILYRDQRQLQVPCDLATGDYPLLIGLYDVNTSQSLPSVTQDGNVVNGLIYLTTFHIE